MKTLMLAALLFSATACAPALAVTETYADLPVQSQIGSDALATAQAQQVQMLAGIATGTAQAANTAQSIAVHGTLVAINQQNAEWAAESTRTAAASTAAAYAIQQTASAQQATIVAISANATAQSANATATQAPIATAQAAAVAISLTRTAVAVALEYQNQVNQQQLNADWSRSNSRVLGYAVWAALILGLGFAVVGLFAAARFLWLAAAMTNIKAIGRGAVVYQNGAPAFLLPEISHTLPVDNAVTQVPQVAEQYEMSANAKLVAELLSLAIEKSGGETHRIPSAETLGVSDSWRNARVQHLMASGQTAVLGGNRGTICKNQNLAETLAMVESGQIAI